jgi:predicted phosphoribosyltransferase
MKRWSWGPSPPGGTRIINEALVRRLSIPNDHIAAGAAAEQQELERHQHAYRGELH